jgi:hypothetical protein
MSHIVYVEGELNASDWAKSELINQQLQSNTRQPQRSGFIEEHYPRRVYDCV